jgi:hypothetical protein
MSGLKEAESGSREAGSNSGKPDSRKPKEPKPKPSVPVARRLPRRAKSNALYGRPVSVFFLYNKLTTELNIWIHVICI